MNPVLMTIIAIVLSALMTIAAFALGHAPDVGGAVGFGTFILHLGQAACWMVSGGMVWHWHLGSESKLKDS